MLASVCKHLFFQLDAQGEVRFRTAENLPFNYEQATAGAARTHPIRPRAPCTGPPQGHTERAASEHELLGEHSTIRGPEGALSSEQRPARRPSTSYWGHLAIRGPEGALYSEQQPARRPSTSY